MASAISVVRPCSAASAHDVLEQRAAVAAALVVGVDETPTQPFSRLSFSGRNAAPSPTMRPSTLAADEHLLLARVGAPDGALHLLERPVRHALAADQRGAPLDVVDGTQREVVVDVQREDLEGLLVLTLGRRRSSSTDFSSSGRRRQGAARGRRSGRTAPARRASRRSRSGR